MTAASSRRRLCRRFVVVVLGLVLSALPFGQVVAAQELDSSGYSPCSPGQPIDLLVMMDASGSLHQRDGIDRDGAKRRTALQEFRARLSALVADLRSADAPEIRVALWRFDASAREIVGFRPPSTQHPSDAEIELSLGDSNGQGGFVVQGRHTDYLTALEQARRAFTAGGNEDACRLLLFFTDGIYDPTGTPSLEQADRLRADVCSDLKPSFEAAGIDTYAILLGDQFRVAGRPADPDEADPDEEDEIGREMALASMQIVRALTGDPTSELTRGLQYSREFGCAQWSDDQPADRDGSVIAIDALDRLAIQLLEVVDVAANGLSEWPECGVASVDGQQSAPLPAGRFIESIVAYPRANWITGYEIVAADGSARRGDGTGVEPLRLDAAEFGDLDGGWTLEILTSGGQGDAGVACYISPASPTSAPSAQGVATADGQQIGPVLRSELGPDSPPRRIEIAAPAPPELCDAAAVEHFEWPDERVADWSCRDDGTVVFELRPLRCQESHDLDAPLVAQVRPAHTGALFGAGEVTVEARVDIDGPASVLYDCLGAPVLSCSGADALGASGPTDGDGSARPEDERPLGVVRRLVVEPDSAEVPRSWLRAASGCVLVPPTEGSATVELVWGPDDAAVLPSSIEWHFDTEFHDGAGNGTVQGDGSALFVGSDGDAGGIALHLVSADELDNGDWDITGTITLVPRWDPGDSELQSSADRLMREQSVELQIEQSYQIRGAPVLSCSGSDADVESDAAELPRSRLRAASGCVLVPPTEGTMTVELVWGPDDAAVLPGDFEWRFDDGVHSGGSRGTVSDDGSVLSVGVDGDAAGIALHLVSADELDNGDWDIAGAITLMPRWDPGDSELQSSADRLMREQSVELQIDQSYLARANSAAAFRLTLALLLVSMAASYLLFCGALVANMGLPDPMGYWMYRFDVPLEPGADGKLSFAAGARGAIDAATGERIGGEASRGGRGKRWMAWESAGLRVALRRPPWFWLPGLLRGAWSAVDARTGDPIAARPTARRRSRHGATASAELPTLLVAGAPRRSPEGHLVASAWVALPRRGRASRVSDVDEHELEALMAQADASAHSADEAASPQAEDDDATRASPRRRTRQPDLSDGDRAESMLQQPAPPPAQEGAERPSEQPPVRDDPGRPPARDRPDRPPPRDRPDRPPPRQR
ncbi:hypothetical protein [Candidatus Poriferisodalis sp.]|uniref:vWA domain-containing protein n=1 Tax=Candidatus Poriferisodalis sp. TaxID=3101277 RepID=UPI003AF4AB74